MPTSNRVSYTAAAYLVPTVTPPLLSIINQQSLIHPSLTSASASASASCTVPPTLPAARRPITALHRRVARACGRSRIACPGPVKVLTAEFSHSLQRACLGPRPLGAAAQLPLIIMTSRPSAHRAPTSSLSLSTSLPESDSLSNSPSHQPKIASKTPAVHALQHQRPGLVSRNSDSSTKTLQPRHHLRNKSSSLVPTLSTLNVGTAPSPRQPPIMASHTTGTSSGAADLLRQAMTR